jgi:nucleotide-binding universal stress UspA family protein
LRTLSAKFGARIVVLHAHEPPAFAYEPFYGATATLPVEAIRTAALERFDRFVAGIDWGGAQVEPRFVDGSPVDEILALEDKVDLVAMGTHGRSAVGRAVLGSVAYGVLKAARRPMLLVPMGEHPATIA